MTHPVTLQEEPLLTRDRIRERVAELGRAISRDLEGEELVVVGVLKGAFVFTADLIRTLDVPVVVDFIQVSSYEGTRSTGVVRFEVDLSLTIEGRDVLIVEDIVDTGLTLAYLLENLRTRHPRSLRTCSLLLKPDNVEREVDVDYVGFEIPDRFVVGYGLDVDEQCRHLPDVAVVEETS